MSQIVYKVVPAFNRWSLMHNDCALASFPTRDEAQRAALAVAARHPRLKTAKVDTVRENGLVSEIRIY